MLYNLNIGVPIEQGEKISINGAGFTGMLATLQPNLEVIIQLNKRIR
jgi:hypothetical protein